MNFFQLLINLCLAVLDLGPGTEEKGFRTFNYQPTPLTHSDAYNNCRDNDTYLLLPMVSDAYNNCRNNEDTFIS